MEMHFQRQDPVPCSRGCGRGCEPTASDPRGSVLGWLAHAVVASLLPSTQTSESPSSLLSRHSSFS
ncbi:hypothetical protein N657DRAFT_639552 [Parathielavia appendiculata]|uniref:Uncharacterized protein n=1 Tax=Parathielavia appendiculata TaxID=2587402 RepID=A0AAN6U9L7_9PEZI|nr:hypothetical protein N657DRAFT_639552 [Parathielavia appendiculata]